MSAVVRENVGTTIMPESTKDQETESFAPLRICLLGYRSHPYSGGQGIYLKYLSAALSDLGHEVEVVSGEPYPQLDPRVKLIKLPSLGLFEKESKFKALKLENLSSFTDMYEWVDANLGGFPEPYTFGLRLEKYMKKHSSRYDIVHDNQSLCYGLLKLQDMGIPTIATIHHPITKDKEIALGETDDKFLKFLIKRWYSFLTMQSDVVKKLDNIVTVSQCSREDIASDFGIDADSLDLIYNGIDTHEFSPMPEIKRKKMQLMATASADAPLKGLSYLLKALAILKDKYPELELTIIGKPKEGGHTERLIEKLDIKDRITFHSGITSRKIRSLYAEATIAIVPSLYEGFGLPAGEAMACGVPLISTTGGSLPEVVGDAGVLVPTKDADALAKAIEKLLEDSALREKLGVQGRQRIIEKFSWQLAAKQMTSYYLKILRNKKAV